MKEYFLFGILCLISPINGIQSCAYMNEQPIVYYEQNVCEERKIEKANEIATSFNQKGFEIAFIDFTCVLDNTNKNT